MILHQFRLGERHGQAMEKNKECEKNSLSCKDSRRDKKQTNTMKKGMTHESKKRNQKKRQTKFPGNQSMMPQM